ncbi:MAG: LEA type 2 family protein [Saprospiraceae bacterium]
MKHFYLFLLLSILSLSSCDTSIINPTFQRIEDVDIVNMSKSDIEANAFMVFKNENSFALEISKSNIATIVDGIELANINQTYDTEMPANSEFRMPINMKMDLGRLYKDNPLGALGKGLQIMSERKLDVQFKGTIKVGKGSIKITVPIDETKEVKF